MLKIINRSTNPYFNLALEEYLLKNVDADIFMLWQNRPAVIVGHNQNTWDEIDVDFVKEQKVAVVRRLTGWGAVYHDRGNLNFTFISRHRRRSGLDFAGFASPIVETLHKLGLRAEFGGRNDIALEGRKVSGNAQYLFQGGILHHGTLLFDTDLHHMVQARLFRDRGDIQPGKCLVWHPLPGGRNKKSTGESGPASLHLRHGTGCAG